MGIFSRHLRPGEIRLYQERDLKPEALKRVQVHLAACSECRQKVEELAQRSRKIQELFQNQFPAETEIQIISPRSAFGEFNNRLERITEEQRMNSKRHWHLPQGAWIALAVCAALVGALTFEPVRTLASDFLALFRVEQVRVIQIDNQDLPQKLENSSELEYIFSNDVQVEQSGEAQEVASLEEASAMLNFPIRLPGQLEDQARFFVQPSGTVDMKVNLELVRGVLKDIEREDIQLPDELDGAHIRLEIPSGLTAHYGPCESQIVDEPVDPDQAQPHMSGWKNCTTLMQIPTPVVSAPPDLDLNKIGEAYLQVLGMDPQEAASFASSVNWTTTFVVPIPRNSVDYEEVQIAGSLGTLIYDKEGYDQHYLLLWIRDGVVFVLGGWGDKPKALQIANSIP